MKMVEITNTAIAEALERVAKLLAEREANPYRIQAYVNAALTARHTDRPLAEMLEEGGREALEELPGIGASLSARIAGFIETGEMDLARQLRDDSSPVDLFARVPGIGRELARRIHGQLKIETLEELELATYDGRLSQVEGFGDRRVRMLSTQINAILNRVAREQLRQARNAALPGRSARPAVHTLLNVDLEYRLRSERGELPLVAPRRFNPSGEAWLPVLHTTRGPWAFTAVFSNTVRAHEADKLGDWAVLYYERDGREGQCTVVTETHGDLEGRRVVRGRESECRDYYALPIHHAA
ncbi:MAG TPA: helix-hairpin-helix domain-containing protein [Rhodothermales bacterium]|nr:helix-hairpin-helix domain-containing protein [Rhodothermales bacterium]